MIELTALVFVALALSIDNCALAVAVGAQSSRGTIAATMRQPLVFAAFATIAPALGWFLGSGSLHVIRGYGSVVACAILVYIGWRTLRSAWHSVWPDHDTALAAVNGAICGAISLTGILAGQFLGGRFPAQGKIVAGLVLSAIGFHALTN